MPAYLCFLGVIAALQLSGIIHVNGTEWIASTTYTVNFLRHPAWDIGHMWSLSIEEHFYLIWPALMAFGLNAGRIGAVAMIFTCFVSRWVVLLYWPHSSAMNSSWTFTRLDTIAWGCLLALLVRDAKWRGRFDRAIASPWTPPILGAAFLATMAASSVSAKAADGLGFTARAIIFSCLVWVVVRGEQSRLGKVLNHPAVVAVGVGSYSLYLWQQIFLNHNRLGFLNSFPQNLLFAGLAAWLSYRFVESPFQRLKDRWIPQPVPQGIIPPMESRPLFVDGVTQAVNCDPTTV